jgi:hypothetical protein
MEGIPQSEAESVPSTMSKNEWRWALLWAAAIVGLSSLPYLLAWQLAPEDVQYTGLLINHFDGASYYAKMQQGMRGDWLFHLAFTPEPHNGSFIFTFYLALGNLARVLRLPIPLTYHLARALAGLFLLSVAYRFVASFFRRVPARRAAFLLLGLSAGLGWLFGPLGIITADLWVVEGFTFLSIFANPHFPLAIGMMLLTFLLVLETSPLSREEDNRRFGNLPTRRLAGAFILGLLLAVIQPFAIPIVLAVLVVYLAILTWHNRRLPWSEIVITGAAAASAAPIMLYDLYVYRTNPALAAWSAQNLTPSLPPWSYVLGYGLVLLLALIGIWVAADRRNPTDLFLLAWTGTVVILLYVPFALQRRFITGLHVPLSLLAAIALEQVILPRVRPGWRGLAMGLIIGFAALTNLLVPVVSVAGVAQGQPPLVMSQDEADASAWLRENTKWTDTVLAPASAGEFIPAWAGNRVVYGHPFETIEAEAKRAEVDLFFSQQATAPARHALLERYDVRYVLDLETDLNLQDLDLLPVWTGREAALFRVERKP